MPSLAIGMITVYLVLVLVLVLVLAATAVNEVIAAVLSSRGSRGKWLLRGVASLFSNSAKDKGIMAMVLRACDGPHTS